MPDSAAEARQDHEIRLQLSDFRCGPDSRLVAGFVRNEGAVGSNPITSTDSVAESPKSRPMYWPPRKMHVANSMSRSVTLGLRATVLLRVMLDTLAPVGVRQVADAAPAAV